MGSPEEGPTEPLTLRTERTVGLRVYFSSLQQCTTTPDHLNSSKSCGHIPTLMNKGAEAGDTRGSHSTPEYGVRWSSRAAALLLMTALLKGQFHLPVMPPPTHTSSIARVLSLENANS